MTITTEYNDYNIWIWLLNIWLHICDISIMKVYVYRKIIQEIISRELYISGRFYFRSFLFQVVSISGRFYFRSFLFQVVSISGRFYFRSFLFQVVSISDRFYFRSFLFQIVCFSVIYFRYFVVPVTYVWIYSVLYLLDTLLCICRHLMCTYV